MMNDSDQIVSLAQVAKDLAKVGDNFLDESTRDFEVTSEEEKEDLESPNINHLHRLQKTLPRGVIISLTNPLAI